ncbi:hypothetical protein OSB04_000679 [Centaurea solstitialis]|uniref:Reverse transcriptase domain-containing protein n=1 Tax=Centaurea solstitialis TaxID=347529 RepID=A0AA38U8Y0_9ASTR|nr:hypothetical protein OSB04_000679 [Centaurea solstitialis]
MEEPEDPDLENTKSAKGVRNKLKAGKVDLSKSMSSEKIKSSLGVGFQSQKPIMKKNNKNRKKLKGLNSKSKMEVESEFDASDGEALSITEDEVQARRGRTLSGGLENSVDMSYLLQLSPDRDEGENDNPNTPYQVDSEKFMADRIEMFERKSGKVDVDSLFKGNSLKCYDNPLHAASVVYVPKFADDRDPKDVLKSPPRADWNVKDDQKSSIQDLMSADNTFGGTNGFSHPHSHVNGAQFSPEQEVKVVGNKRLEGTGPEALKSQNAVGSSFDMSVGCIEAEKDAQPQEKSRILSGAYQGGSSSGGTTNSGSNQGTVTLGEAGKPKDVKDSVMNDVEVPCKDKNGGSSERVSMYTSFADALRVRMGDVEFSYDYTPSIRDENGKSIVLLSKEVILEGKEDCSLCLYGFFCWEWFTVQYVSLEFEKDVAEFNSLEGMNFVLESGPWVINGDPFFVRQWEMCLCRKPELSRVPVWISIFGVPLECWNYKGICQIASGIGIPLTFDKATKDRCLLKVGRMAFARVMVEVAAEDGLPDSVVVRYPFGDGKENEISLGIEPDCCTFCKVFGHSEVACGKRPRTEAEVIIEEVKIHESRENKVVGDDGFHLVGKKNKVVKQVDGSSLGDQGRLSGLENAHQNRFGQGNNWRSNSGGYQFKQRRPNFKGGDQNKWQFVPKKLGGDHVKGQSSGSKAGGNSNKVNGSNGQSKGDHIKFQGNEKEVKLHPGGGLAAHAVQVLNVGGNKRDNEGEKKADKGKGKIDGPFSSTATIETEQNGKEDLSGLHKNDQMGSKKGGIATGGSVRSGNNPFAVLSELDDAEVDWERRKRMVDCFIKRNLKPSNDVLKQWNEMQVKMRWMAWIWVGVCTRFSMLSLLTWNIRGLNEFSKKKVVRDHISRHGVKVCCLLENKVCSKNLSKVCLEVFGGWFWLSNNSSGVGRTRILVGWDPKVVKVELISHSSQVLLCKILLIDSPKWFYCSFVYAANDCLERRVLWDHLRCQKMMIKIDPWCIVGDFNVALFPADSSSGSSSSSRGMVDFKDCLDDLEVEDINSSGVFFTWIQKLNAVGQARGVLKKLDRGLGSLNFLECFPRAHMSFLPYSISDHSPMLLFLQGKAVFRPKPFKFDNHLTEMAEFLPTVARVWDSHIHGCVMYSVVTKLKLLKGSVSEVVSKLRFELEHVQNCMVDEPENVELRKEEVVYLNAFKDALFREELFLKQRAKVDWLKEGDSNSAYFHKVVKGRINRSRIERILDADGNCYVGKDVAGQFVKHFDNFLGKSVEVKNFHDPVGLFIKKLSREDADFMVRRVDDDEIKLALFSIDDEKSPGPDDFNAKFFKKAWSIVGVEVSEAIKQFFDNGKLLSEVNATLIALVAKVSSPSSVVDFRPIVCCNVLYKCISKVIANRIKGYLDFLVDENQSTFIPQRQIGDNILLAQELMRGYHRQRGAKRCAFKVDIQKAYDMVNWSFLEQSLKYFGFHPCMIHWLMKCISSTSYAINVNGEQVGHFRGKRGIRQGDPLSPYLFTLVMEVFNLILKRKIKVMGGFKYHNRCEKLSLTHLCFADDLMMFCNGDVRSVSIMKAALEEFSDVSGLKPNMGKSTSYLGNINGVCREEILKILPFNVGELPVRYLGVPLIATKLFHKDCKVLIDKVKKRVLDWKNKSLSFAGRLQLLQSVISSIQVYWSSLFVLPVSVIKEIEHIMKGFLWNNGELMRGKAKVSWKEVCLDKKQGGLGLRSLRDWNHALMAKHIWSLIEGRKSLWVKWIHTYRLTGRNFWDANVVNDAAWGWRKIVRLRGMFREHIVHQIGNGENTSLWFDNWHAAGPLCKFISRRDIYLSGLNVHSKVSDLWNGVSWCWPRSLIDKYGGLLGDFCPRLRGDCSDSIKWRDKEGRLQQFGTGAVWRDLKQQSVVVPWAKRVWFHQNIPRHSFILWLAVKEKLRTLDKLVVWNINQDQKCIFCLNYNESHSHIFVDCSYAKEVWLNMLGISRMGFLFRNEGDLVFGWPDLVSNMNGISCGKSCWGLLQRWVLGAVVYYIWQERNARLFQGKVRNAEGLCNIIKSCVKLKMMGSKFKTGPSLKKMMEVWELDNIS